MSKASLAEPPNLVPDRTALFLDYDGTLVNIAATPDEAVADDALRELLDGLDRKFSGAVALVSGRRVADIDGFLAPLRLTVAGLHGLELRSRSGRTLECGGAAGPLAKAREALRELHLRTPGTLLEDKRLTVAFHYRNAPEAEHEATALAGRLKAESEGALELLRGKMVVELLPAGRDKGRAIEDMLGLPEFAGRRPVFIGDDVTDEAGFKVVNARDGISVRVGTRHGHTEARWQLADVQALRQWLRTCLDGEAPQ